MSESSRGQAFPDNGRDGMSLFDYFAGQALMGLATSMNLNGLAKQGAKEAIAKQCYDIAEVMVKEKATRNL